MAQPFLLATDWEQWPYFAETQFLRASAFPVLAYNSFFISLMPGVSGPKRFPPQTASIAPQKIELDHSRATLVWVAHHFPVRYSFPKFRVSVVQ